MPKNLVQVTLSVEKNGNSAITNVTGAGHNCQQLTEDVENRLGKVDKNSRQATDSLYQDVDKEQLTISHDAPSEG